MDRYKNKKEILRLLDFPENDCRAWSEKHIALRRNTSQKEHKCILSFREYMMLVKEAGLYNPLQIGRTRGSFQMARIGDSGNYELGNCRFITQQQNILEKHMNGGTASAALKKTGSTCSILRNRST